MRCSKLLLAGMVLATCAVALAQTPDYKNVGRAPTKEEIQAWDIAVGPDGKGLPQGSGTAKDGAPIYAQKCASCHGANAEGGQIGPRLAIGKESLESLKTVRPVKGLVYWPFATTIWDYINRSMPRNLAGSLSANEVYALTAYLLFRCGVLKETDVLDAKTLPKLQMPNRNTFVPQNFAELPDERKRGCRQGVCP